MLTLAELLRRDEGLRLKVYFDSVGKPTIGYGRCLSTQGVTEAEAEYLLGNDIKRVQKELADALPWYLTLSPIRQIVLQSMAFQLGTAGLLRFKIMLKCAAAGQWREAARQINTSLFASQCPGRAQRLASMMATNTEPPGA